MTIQAKKYTDRFISSTQRSHGQWLLTAHGGRKDGSKLLIFATQYDHIQSLVKRGNGYVGKNIFDDLWSQFEF